MKVWDKAPLLPLAGCFIVGIVSRVLIAQWTAGLALLVVAVAVTMLLRKWARWQTAGIMACMVLLGMTLGARRQQVMDATQPGKDSVMEVVVFGEPMLWLAKDSTKKDVVAVDVLTAQQHRKLRLRFNRDERSEQISIGQGLLARTYYNKVIDWRWREVSLQGLSRLERVQLRALLWRHQLLERYRQWGMEGDTYAVLAAMTLGDKSALGRDIRMMYSKVGASHILALSGMHLMVIYAMITLLIGSRRFRIITQVVTVLAIWAFALLVGLAPSVVRAAAMVTTYSLLSLGYRERMSLNTLAFVAIVMLIVNPLALYDVGFQLSFMAVLAILLLNPLMQQVVPPHIQIEHRWLSMLWGVTTISFAAQIGTAPLVAYYFGQLPTYFLLTNFIVIPLATVILYLALLCMAVSFWPWAVSWMTKVLAAVVELMNSVLGWIAQLPYCSISGLHPSVTQVALVYVVIGCAYIVVSLRYPATRRNV